MNLYKNKNEEVVNLDFFGKFYVIKYYDGGYCIEGLDIESDPWTIDSFDTKDEAMIALEEIYNKYSSQKTPDTLSEET